MNIDAKNQAGFGIIGILVVIVALTIIGVGGWSIYNKDHKTSYKTTTTQKNKTNAAKSTNSPPFPVLGTASWGQNLKGYGAVKPVEIFGNGDPTSIATDISWQSWGGSQATGTGLSIYVSGNEDVSQAPQEQAKIVAFNLGTCEGVPSYDAVTWYFPQYGEAFNPNHYWDTCTGKDV
jgi:hypothetical protein